MTNEQAKFMLNYLKFNPRNRKTLEGEILNRSCLEKQRRDCRIETPKSERISLFIRSINFTLTQKAFAYTNSDTTIGRVYALITFADKRKDFRMSITEAA